MASGAGGPSPFYYQIEGDRLQRKTLSAGAIRARSIGSWLGVCEASTTRCAKLSLEALNHALQRRNIDLTPLTEADFTWLKTQQTALGERFPYRPIECNEYRDFCIATKMAYLKATGRTAELRNFAREQLGRMGIEDISFLDKLSPRSDFQSVFLRIQRYHTLIQEMNKLGKQDLIPQLLEAEDVEASLSNLLAQKDSNGNSILHLAALNGRTELVKWLIDRGMDPTDINKNGDSILHLAALNGRTELVKWLIKEKRIYPDNTNRQGNTALQLAAYGGHTELVKWLITEGKAHSSPKNRNGDSLLHMAAASGQIELVRWLIQDQHMTPNDFNKDYDSLLHIAARYGHTDLVKFLVDDVKVHNYMNKYGDAALHAAAQSGNIELVKWLIDIGMNPSYRNTNGDSILHFAAYYGHQGLVQWLIEERGMGLRDINNAGDTILHSAAQSGNKALVQWLIAKGCDPRVTNHAGHTPDHYLTA